ncbi:transposase, partial [uncultured Selenomonas sp.]|uniref:transposase n=1 Tax=uncultured Selenomonas sp. TaxID=159275 RepID=UPI0028DB1643
PDHLDTTLLDDPPGERETVLLASRDLCAFFHTLIEECFPNAEIVADKFHALRLANNALDVIRKQEQEKIDPADKKWFKNSRHVLLGRKKKLKEKDKAELIKMLGFSVKLAHAHQLKEEYFGIFDSKSRQEYKKKLQDFADKVEKYDIDEFKRVLRTSAADGHAGRGVAGQAGADQESADGTGVRRREATQVGFDLCGIPFFLLLAD